MFCVAYDKNTHKIKGFIGTDDDINPLDVFTNFDNYEYKFTHIKPPFSGYEHHKVTLENGEIVGYEETLEHNTEE